MYPEGNFSRFEGLMATTKEIAKNNSMFASLQKVSDDAGTGAIAPLEIKESGVPYVGFYSTKATKAAEIAAAVPGINPGQPYLAHPTKGYQRLSNFKFHILNRTLHWVQRDSENKPIRATNKDPGDMYGPLKENFETLILVYTDDGTVVPALATFNVAKAPVGRVATKTLYEAATDEWFTKSADHAATKTIPNPEYRFTVNVTSFVKPAKTSGFPTVNARATTKPSTIGELQMLAKSIEDPSFGELFSAAKTAFNNRIGELDKLASISG